MKRSVVLLLHTGYWLLYLILVFFLAVGLFQDALNAHRITIGGIMFRSPVAIFFFVPSVTGFYAFYTLLFPRFLQKKRIVALMAGIVLVTLLTALIGAVVLTIHSGAGFMFADGFASFFSEMIAFSFMALVHGVVALVMRGFISWYGDIQLKAELDKKNYDMEVALIKAQINPHFLFNTINNIDILIKKDPDKASEYLNKLSDILRFTLYDTKSERIELSKELAYIDKFIELQKIRTSNTDYVRYTIKGDAGAQLIEPMLFIPFIENAFKHAENKKTEHAVSISFEITKEQIRFTCENHYTPNGQLKPEHSGLGNGLIKRRLELLYPGKHTLEIIDLKGVYTINLVLSLT